MMGLVRSLALGAALALLTLPLSAVAQQSTAPDKPAAASEEKVSAEDAFKRGEEADDQDNFGEAMKWYRIAAEQGYAPAQVRVGNLYTEGEGVEKDYGEALKWYRKAADQGDHEAENNIGWFYFSGWGVAQDYGQAMEWFRKSAEQGNEVAARNVAMMYLDGLGVAKDKTEAIRWFKKAAEAGDDEAKEELKQLEK